MALVIVSTGALADSSVQMVSRRRLAAATAALALAGLLGGLALGFQLGNASADAGRSMLQPDLDSALPGDQALIHQIGALSGRLIRLEAVANRLSDRVGESPAAAPRPRSTATTPRPAGGPLLAPLFGDAPVNAASLRRLDSDLDEVEASLDLVGAMIAQRELDQMAFPSRTPIPGVGISSSFGRRLDPFTGEAARHTGLDYPAPYGTPILASAGGRVRLAGMHGAYGRTVEIDHGDGLVTRYGHASRILVRVGDVVLPGQAIARVGSTGRSTGAHLHFEVLREGKAVHPGPYLARDDS